MKKMKKTLSLKVAAMVSFLAIVGTAMALSVNSLTDQGITLYDQSNTEGDFTIASAADLSWAITDKNTLTITVVVTNTDAGAPHEADVTVNLLDGSGDLVVSGSVTIATGSVIASGTNSDDFVFSIAGVNEAAYFAEVFVEIDQTS